MTLRDNFCHADMHPGNILVSFRKGTEYISAQDLELLKKCQDQVEWTRVLRRLNTERFVPELIVLDVGLVNQLSLPNQRNLRDCFHTALEGNGERLAALFIERSLYPEQVREQELFKAKMISIFTNLNLNSKGQLLLKDLFAVNIVQGFANLVRTHHITLDGDFSGLLCAAMIVEGIGRKLDANLDVIPVLSDYVSLE
jgi:aarF domain-containing kinase